LKSIQKIFTEELEREIAINYLVKKNINPLEEKKRAYQVLRRKGFSSNVINILINFN
jgi:SOS response regulatory protein OraA/RecX